MGFFKGATGVVINGGTFNNFEKGGRQIIYDQSQHYTNVNSFNTSNHAIIDSNNDHSRTTYGSDPKGIRDRDQKRSRVGSDNQDDIAQYFPPPTIHPAMQHTLHPPGVPANVSNANSYNINNTRMTNAYNDYSQTHGLPPAKRRKHSRRTVSDDYQVPESGGEYDNPTSPSGSTDRRQRQHPYAAAVPPPPTPYSHPYPPQMQAMYSSDGPGNSQQALFPEGQIQTMPGPLRQAFGTLMQQLQDQLSPQPNPQYATPPQHGPAPHGGPEEREDEYEEGGEEGSDEDEEDESDEDDTRMEDPPAALAHKIGNLSLNDNPRPSSSNLKSREHRSSSNPPQSLHVPPPGRRRAGSAQEIPVHPRQPFVARSETLSTASSSESSDEESDDEIGPDHPPQSTNHPPNPPNPPWSPNIPPLNLNIQPPNIPPLPSNLGPSPGSILSGFHHPMSSIQGPAVFNQVQGDLVQIDRTVHAQNINSGNTHNTLIKDSYNDNSVATHYAPLDPVSSKKTGKYRSSRRRE